MTDLRLSGHSDGRQSAKPDTPNIKGDKTLTSIYLIDAYAMIYRAYLAFLRAPKINTNGINTSPIYGFISSFTDLVLKRRPDYVAVAFDLHGLLSGTIFTLPTKPTATPSPRT